jgi:DNA sulfur modification protein DndC
MFASTVHNMHTIGFWTPGNSFASSLQIGALEEPYARARRRIKSVLGDGHPAILAYSGGKDSSTLVSIALDVARELISEQEICPPLILVTANTGVEQPELVILVTSEIRKMKAYAKRYGIPLSCHISHPELSDTFGVRVIGGRGLPSFPDTRGDCSVMWKIKPNERTVRQVFKDLGQQKVWADPVIFTGVRLEESQARDQRIASRGEKAEGLWSTPEGRLHSSPILDFDSSDVWEHIGLCNAGERDSFSDFTDVMRIYSSAGGDSCVIVADMKSSGNSKPCGTRTGCFLCCRVGEDRSMQNMIASDPARYGHLKPLAALRDFVSRTQYDWSRRHFVGRTVDKDGFITIQADVYNPPMLEELLRYTLSAQVLSGIEIISLEQLIGIDARWSQYGLFPPFSALKIYLEVEAGDIRMAPELPRFPKTEVPRIGRIRVCGESYADNLKGEVSGLRNVAMELHHESCGFELRTLNDGSIVIDVETQSNFTVDPEGAAEFLTFVAEEKIATYCHESCSDWTFGFSTYLEYGTIGIRKGRSTQCHEILQRSQWRQKHQLHGHRTVAELENRCDVLFTNQLALI